MGVKLTEGAVTMSPDCSATAGQHYCVFSVSSIQDKPGREYEVSVKATQGQLSSIPRSAVGNTSE